MDTKCSLNLTKSVLSPQAVQRKSLTVAGTFLPFLLQTFTSSALYTATNAHPASRYPLRSEALTHLKSSLSGAVDTCRRCSRRSSSSSIRSLRPSQNYRRSEEKMMCRESNLEVSWTCQHVVIRFDQRFFKQRIIDSIVDTESLATQIRENDRECICISVDEDRLRTSSFSP